MVIVDSCGWLEWFTDGELAGKYKTYLEDTDALLVPSIVLYEVYKVLKREVSEETALLAAGFMKSATTVLLNEKLALAAADIALSEKLAMADAIILATAQENSCTVVTSDTDLKGKPQVKYIPRR